MDVGSQQQAVLAIGRRRQRIEFLATSEAERAAPVKEERHIGAELRADCILVDGSADQGGQGADNRCGVRRAASQTATHRDALGDADAHFARNARGLQRQLRGGLGKILAGNGDVRGDFDTRAAAAREGDVQTVSERDRVEDRADLVVAVGALAKHGQRQVDLGVGEHPNATQICDLRSLPGSRLLIPQGAFTGS